MMTGRMWSSPTRRIRSARFSSCTSTAFSICPARGVGVILLPHPAALPTTCSICPARGVGVRICQIVNQARKATSINKTIHKVVATRPHHADNPDTGHTRSSPTRRIRGARFSSCTSTAFSICPAREKKRDNRLRALLRCPARGVGVRMRESGVQLHSFHKKLRSSFIASIRNWGSAS